ncbi:MAG: nucleotide exchange factor GrpE [Acidobacteriota bacterium]
MDDSRGDWKIGVIEDFARWLARIPDDVPPPLEEEKTTFSELVNLYSELASLRRAILLQNRQQSKALRELRKSEEDYRASMDLFRRRSQDLDSLEARTRLASERRCLIPFLDVRDALLRGRKASLNCSPGGAAVASGTLAFEGLAQGYEMAIDRFDRALAQSGIRVVQTVGKPFDPRTMAAVEVRAAPDLEEGFVVEEFQSGFVRGEEVVRPAEVAVNRHRKE